MSQLAFIVSTTTMQQCQELIDKVREFRYLKVWERQINKFNRLLQKQEGNITYADNPQPSAREECRHRQCSVSQAGQSPSPSNGTLAATAPDNCHNSQPGDVVGNAGDQGGGPAETTVPSSSATSSPDNVSSDARDQGL